MKKVDMPLKYDTIGSFILSTNVWFLERKVIVLNETF